MINTQEILKIRTKEVGDSIKECLADLMDNGYDISMHPLDADARHTSLRTVGGPSYQNQFDKRGYWVVRLIKPDYNSQSNQNNRHYGYEEYQRIDLQAIATPLSFFISYIQDSTEFEVVRMQPYIESDVGTRSQADMNFCVDKYDSHNYMVEPYFWKHGRNWISALYSELGRRGHMHMWSHSGYGSELKCIEIILSDRHLSHIFYMREQENKNSQQPIIYHGSESWIKRTFNRIFRR